MSTFYVPSSESTTLSAIAPSVSRDSANSAPTMHWDLAHFLTTPPMSAPASFCSFPQHDLQIRPSTDAGLVDSQPFDFSHLAQASPHNSSALPSTSHLPSPASLPPPSPLSRSLSSQSATPATLSELAAILKAPRPKSPRKPTIKKEKRASKARAITTKHPPLRNEMPSVLVPMDVKPTSVLEVPKLEVVVPEPLFRAASPEAVEMPHTPPSSATSPIASTLVASPVSASFAPLGDWTTFSLPPTPTVEAGLPLNVALMTADEEERKPKRPKKMPEGYIKRPSNAWMIYRSARVKEFAERQKNGGSVVPPQSDLCPFFFSSSFFQFEVWVLMILLPQPRSSLSSGGRRRSTCARPTPVSHSPKPKSTKSGILVRASPPSFFAPATLTTSLDRIHLQAGQGREEGRSEEGR